jgi:ATP phosphoribosyltransferase
MSLTIAVPRGALFKQTLDLLDAIGIDTGEVRSNDRKLLFRDVGMLLDLGYGACTMVLASVAGEDPMEEARRRLGVVRVATKYPKIAARHFAATGRQAEMVEVKGSVELAPLTGLVDGIVDLTATGTTLRENGLVVREEIVVCTARLIANPVAHKLKAAAIDELLERVRAA